MDVVGICIGTAPRGPLRSTGEARRAQTVYEPLYYPERPRRRASAIVS
jgi:hypothetical protein